MREARKSLEGKILEIPEFKLLDIKRILLGFGAYLLEEPKLDVLQFSVPLWERLVNYHMEVTPTANWKGHLGSLLEGKHSKFKMYCEIGACKDGSRSEHVKIYRGINFPQLHIGWSAEVQGPFQDNAVVAAQYTHGVLGFFNPLETKGKWLRAGFKNKVDPIHTKMRGG